MLPKSSGLVLGKRNSDLLSLGRLRMLRVNPFSSYLHKKLAGEHALSLLLVTDKASCTLNLNCVVKEINEVEFILP